MITTSHPMPKTNIQGQTKQIHPKVFALWLGLGSVIMMFAGLTSAHIVRKAQGNWVEFKLPSLFYISTALILISSIVLVFAVKAFKSENWNKYRIILGTTSFLGLGFLVTQVFAWKELTSYGILLNGNPSGSFLYLISGLHLFHVLGGVVAMLILFIKAFSLNHDPISQAKRSINPNNGLGLKLMSIYWHFIGILWIYLLAFLSFT